jgi:hypothetical protein
MEDTMKIKLGELLVKENMITVTQLGQALKAQRVYGNRLGTNLVELGFISSSQLTEFLAKQLSLTAARPSDFEDIPDSVIRMVGTDFAIDHQVIPLSLVNNKLRVAFADPLNLKHREALAFQVGVPIIPLIAAEQLINYGLEKYYDHTINQHFVRLETNESGMEEASIEDVLIRNPLDELEPDFDEISKVELLKNVGEYSLEGLSKDLFNAVSRQDIFRALFKFLEPSFSNLAVFIARHQEIWGWMQQGYHIEQDAFRRQLLSMDDQSIIVDTFRNPDIHSDRSLEDRDKTIVLSMNGDPDGTYHLFPIIVGGRAVAVVLACGHGVKIDKLIDPVQEALTKVTIALQMVRLRRKLIPAQ